MKLKDRSCYGQGLIAFKSGLKLKDNPFTDELLADIPKAKLWRQGFLDAKKKRFGDLLKYKDGTSKTYDMGDL